MSRRHMLGGVLAGASVLTVPSLLSACSVQEKGNASGATPPPSETPSTPPPVIARFGGDPGEGNVLLGVSLGIDQLAKHMPDFGKPGITLSRRFYRSHQIQLMDELVQTDAAAGIVPFVSLKTPVSWQDVAKGRADRWLDSVIETLGNLPGPAMLALHHEPENDHSSGGNTPNSWKEMQRRAIARASGFPMLTVVPVLMQWTFDPASGRDPQQWLIPESPVLGVDVYNTWRTDGTGTWVEFETQIGQVRQVVPDIPLMVPEFGCAADNTDPGRSSRWMSAAYDSALKNNVPALAWFDSEYNNKIGDMQLRPQGKATMRKLLDRPTTVFWDHEGAPQMAAG